MIKQNTAPRALGWTGFLAICGMAAILLPLSATLAQQEKPQPAGLPPVAPAVEVAPKPEAPITPPAGVGVAPGDVGVGIAVENNDPNAAQREAQALEEELQKTSAEIQKLTARLKAAQSRLVELRQRTRLKGADLPEGEMGGYPALPATRARGRYTTPVPNQMPGNAGGGGGYGAGGPYGGGFGGNVTTPNNDQEQRLRTVEKKLDLLIEELREMHKDRAERPDQQDQPQRQQGFQRR